MLAVAGLLGVSQFVLVQWVAPFLSEFPEKVSAFYWARRVTHAPMALMNLVSSNINQWTVLAAMIPLVYGYSSLHHHGAWRDFRFDDAQRLEVLLGDGEKMNAECGVRNAELKSRVRSPITTGRFDGRSINSAFHISEKRSAGTA